MIRKDTVCRCCFLSSVPSPRFSLMKLKPHQPPAPLPHYQNKVMFISDKINIGISSSLCIFSYDAWEVRLKRYPQSVHFYKIWGKKKYKVTLRKHAYSNTLRILPPKYENFQMKNSDIFLTSAQNIDCRYSLEPPRWGGSNEYPQSMFLNRNR